MYQKRWVSTSTAPSATSRTCVARSTIARMKLSLADSPKPRMFRPASATITISPPKMSRDCGSALPDPERRQVVGYEERRDRNREDVVEHSAQPAKKETSSLKAWRANEEDPPASGNIAAPSA